MKKILVCGHNPMTGPRHLGHYLSTMRDWTHLEKDYEVFIIIDDLIASILYPKGISTVQEKTFQVAKEFIATGIDKNRTHIILTSMIPEVHELALWTSLTIDQDWCMKLYKESFAGLLSSYQRSELQLPRDPTVTEVIYPQIHLATLTLGLRAARFQGGEEMRGYMEIMKVMANGLQSGGEIQAPELLLDEKNSFILGIDGLHMASENAIYISSSEQELGDDISKASKDVLIEWLNAFSTGNSTSIAPSGYDTNTPREELTKMLTQSLSNEFRKFREDNIPNSEIVAILEHSAIVAREQVKKTLTLVKSHSQVPGFTHHIPTISPTSNVSGGFFVAKEEKQEVQEGYLEPSKSSG